MKTEKIFEDSKIHIKQKLSALWAAVMFCYIYADILGFYDPWLLGEIMQGSMGPLGPITQGLKLGVAVLMSIPALMVFLSLALKSAVNRWLNIGCGILFTLVILVTLLMGPWFYYIYFGFLEMALTSLVAWYAWSWPAQET
jgi:hypothetical protein